MITQQWLHHVEECPSTNTWALERLAQLHHGEVVFTQRQTAGRGQNQRPWYSPPGVLTASFILEQLRPYQLPSLSLASGLAVIEAVEELLPHPPGELRLKWPNDVMLRGRKLAGILCETKPLRCSSQNPVVVGIGLNLRVDFTQSGLRKEPTGNPISLHEIYPEVPNDIIFLEKLRYYLIQMAEIIRKTDELAFLPELRHRDLLLHRHLTLRDGGESFSGQGAGLDSRGRLLLKLNGGEMRAFASGRVVDWA